MIKEETDKGWSDTDRASALAKVKAARSNERIKFTDRERRAHIARIREILEILEKDEQV